jgi:HEPN domain-containing protein
MGNDYKKWLARARSNLIISKTRTDEYVYFEDLCFQAQQAVEKAIKGLLIFYNVDPEKTHNLVSLIKELSKHTELSEEVNETSILNNYAVQTRYPGDYTSIGEEYNDAVIIAEKCIKWIEKKIKESEIKINEEKNQPYLDNLEI